MASLEAADPNTVLAILEYHIIPPHPGINAVWTTPFFKASDSAAIATALPNANLNFTTTA